MAENSSVLVIGAGLAGIEASLLLSNAGRKVYLVERNSYFGGTVIKSEEVFPNMECATCMIAPKQSQLLEDKNIELLTLTDVTDIQGEAGDFTVKLAGRARYVSLVNCIGCGACFEPCPVSVDNEFEEGLMKRKAIFLACAGALPNAPAIDMEYCLLAKGEDCTACKDACMFDAISFDDKDEEKEIKVGAIVVATGYKLGDVSRFVEYGYGKIENVFHAFEFERLRASNGPTEGAIKTRDGTEPKSIGLIHCVGRAAGGYCSQVCCMYLTKFACYAFDKVEGVEVHEFFRELSTPGKAGQKFLDEAKKKGTRLVRTRGVELSGNGKGVRIAYQDGEAEKSTVDVDMVVLAPCIEPNSGADALAKLLGIERDDFGFYKTAGFDPVATNRAGVFVAGCNEGPKSMQDVVAQAEAAVAAVLNPAQN